MQAEVETFVLDSVFMNPPDPPDDKTRVTQLAYRHFRQQSVRDQMAPGS